MKLISNNIVLNIYLIIKRSLSTVIVVLLFLLLISSYKPVHALSSSSFQEIIIDSASDGTPTDPWGKGYGDLNGDGKIDILIGSMGSGLAWYQNPGTVTSTWTRRVINTGAHSTDVEIGDIDGDGDNDVVAVTSSNTRWYRNNDGLGTSWTAFTVGNRVMHDLELADFNGDGRLDVVTRNQGSDGNEVYLYMQSSSGTFIESGRTDMPWGEGLLVHDLDGDGDQDIIWNDVWLQNPGTGAGISNWAKYTYTSSPWHDNTFIAVCDMNKDGRKDIVMSPSEWQGGTYRISYFQTPVNPTTSNWPEIVIDSNVETIHHFVGCGDFDRDGDMDIAAAEMQQGSDPDEVKIYENTGTSFVKRVIDTGGSHSMRIVDIDGDGDLDLFGANWSGAQDVKLWINNSSPSTLPLNQWTYIKADSSRTSWKFGIDATLDVTGDGYKDIISGQYFYRNPGGVMTGTWPRTTLPNVGGESPDGLLLVNIDDDAFGDAIAMNANGEVFWLEATTLNGSAWTNRGMIGDVGAADEGISTQGYTLSQIVAGGKPEIVINVAERLAYFEIPSNPTIVPWPMKSIRSTGVQEPEGVFLGDIDGDGDLDIASNLNTTTVAWWRNPGNGTENWQYFTIGSVPSYFVDRVGLADLDGDGDLDLAVTAANGDNNGVYWFRSPATKTNAWTRITILSNATVDTMNSMDVADMDQDGDPDIITAEHRGDQRLFILENNGSGTFMVHTISTGIENHLGARVFDLDNDGDLDIIGIAWDSYQNLHIWRNDALSSGIQVSPTPSPLASNLPSPSSTATFTIGETNLLPNDDSSNANLIVSQKVTLSQSATLQSLSFYVINAAGKLRLGIYNDVGGQPGNLLTQTAEFNPIVGWNTQNVLASVLLPTGDYWLAYMPSDNNLHFSMDTTGSGAWASVLYGSMPVTFPQPITTGAYHWSFYATFTINSTPTPTPNPADVNGSGGVDFNDLKLILSNWLGIGTCATFVCDLNSDSKINAWDASLVIANWGN